MNLPISLIDSKICRVGICLVATKESNPSEIDRDR